MLTTTARYARPIQAPVETPAIGGQPGIVAWLIGTQSAAAARSLQPSRRIIRPRTPPRPTIGQRQRPARPKRTSGTRPTGISRTAILAAGAVLEPINTIKARQPKARRPTDPT